MYQWYLSQKQLPSQQTKNYPQRRPIDEPSPHRVFVYNTGSEIIPAYACMRVTGTRNINNVTAIEVEKPTSTDGEFLFNSQYPIAVPSSTETGVGWAYRFGVVVMLGDDPTAPGVEYLPIVDSWEVEEGAGPFVVYGHHRANEEGDDRALIGRFAGGSAAGEMIQFQPTDVCEGIGLTCDCVTATVLTASCGSSVQPGDTIQVWDQSRGWFQMPEELLFASVGWAHKVKVTEAEQYDLPFDVGPCRYVVISMDCIEQEPV
jgi:hypothetical protein